MSQIAIPSWADIEANLEPGAEWQCPEHGPYSTAFECTACRVAADQAEREFYDAWRRYGWWRNSSGVPPRYRSALPDRILPLSPGARRLRTAVEAYSADMRQHLREGTGLRLLGGPGLGKTFALCALVNAASQRLAGAQYWSWPALVADIKASISGPREDPRRGLIDRLAAVPLLALDELGLRASTDFEAGELFRLIDRRYQNKLPTLVASNATADAFADAVGERIADRLIESGATLVVSGASCRGKLTQQDLSDALPEPPREIITQCHRLGRWSSSRIYRDDEVSR
jgi:hypothetical protein